MWARNLFNNIRNNIDLDKIKVQAKKVAQSSLGTNIANTIITGSVTYAFSQIGKEKKLEEAQARIDALQLRCDRTDAREQMIKNRIDSLIDELRNTDRKKVELDVQLLAVQSDLKAIHQEKEVFKSAYEKTWLCFHKPQVNVKATINDDVFLASTSKNKISS